MRPAELDEVVQELNARVVGAVAQKAWCPLPRLAYLELRVPGRSLFLCVCAEGELARVSLARERFPTPGEPAPFQRWLRQELTGLKLVRARHEAPLRLVALDFERQEPGEAPHRRTLLLELSAPGGLLLLTPEARVLMLSGEGLAQRRALHPGATWKEPEPLPPEALARALAQPSRLGAVPPAAEGADEAPFAPRLEAAEALLGVRDRRARAESIRRRLTQPYRARLKRSGRTLEKVRAEAARGSEAEEHRRLGELLAQNLWRLKRGDTAVTLSAYTDAGEEQVEVKLDPRRSPKEEVEWHFHQYRRLLRGVEAARAREATLAREVAHAQEALSQLERLSEEDLIAQVEVLGQAGEEGPSGEGRPYKEYLGHGGQRIWVGRGAESNDQLTFKLARPFHLWLHARGLPGSHVVVPLEREQEVSQEVLLDAAHLALHHSGAKGEPRGEVSYVPVKFVRKMKGGAPGQVLYSRERTFVVRLEPERLKRLLDSQTGAH
ncbi:NFACT RNA binding domain-containing protein [Aggregicoccus sp. 17bor-14]|uniref:NFACT RNA binding domain-containing protein n=1 Tax=Myxococcaceae TaxID=31 RepID=UPI003519DFB9